MFFAHVREWSSLPESNFLKFDLSCGRAVFAQKMSHWARLSSHCLILWRISLLLKPNSQLCCSKRNHPQIDFHPKCLNIQRLKMAVWLWFVNFVLNLQRRYYYRSLRGLSAELLEKGEVIYILLALLKKKPNVNSLNTFFQSKISLHMKWIFTYTEYLDLMKIPGCWRWLDCELDLECEAPAAAGHPANVDIFVF